MTGTAPDAPDPDGDLYDSYLDGALAGTAEEPETFLARHGAVSGEVRARIAAMHRVAAAPAPAPRRSAPDRVAEPGLPRERCGEFRLLRRIGSGGMGVVYEAEQVSLGRLVAVKVLRPDLLVSPEARERFRREAQAAARLRHPGIVPVLAAGEDEGTLWIAMDLVEGTGLDRVLADAVKRGEAIAPARAARIAARLARALEVAHGSGVVHRDVKPANVLLDNEDAPHLLDFGVARDLDAGTTLAGPFVGSVPWAAPEQLAGRTVDGRADVYALGATLFHALTGRVPFEERSVDRAIHRILHEDAVAPGRLRSGIPRDLDAVVLRALEKNPADRYAGARALAEDLEAVLDFRPVRARPPGPVRRFRSWTRLHPAMAAGVATGVLATGLLAAAGVLSGVRARERTRREIHDELASSSTLLETFSRQRNEAADIEKEVGDLRDLLESRWLPPETDAALEVKEDELRHRRHSREAAFQESLDHLRRAERLGADAADVNGLRARLYLERWKDAEAARDRDGAETYRNLVAASDPDGALIRSVFGEGFVTFRSDTPGAELHLFRWREEAELRPGGERRLVPVPPRPSPVRPGSFALRVVGGAGELRPGDLILEVAGHGGPGGAFVLADGGGLLRGDRVTGVDLRGIDDLWDLEDALAVDDAATRKFVVRVAQSGELSAHAVDAATLRAGDLRALAESGGLPARVLTGGALRDVILPAGLDLRPTMAPLPLGPWSLAGTVPLEGVPLAPGSWLALFRAPGREDQRWLFVVQAEGRESVDVALAPAGLAPPGFPRVPRGDGGWVRVLDREVTAGEYLEFLNDPTVAARIPPAGEPPRFVPRNRRDAMAGHWQRGADGRFVLPADWPATWPVLGVSFDDARAYAAWRTHRDGPLGGRGEYALPTLLEWLQAAGRDNRPSVCGTLLRPRWIKSCYARPRPGPEPVLRYPRDESPLGIFDMAGSVAEWTDDVYDRAQGTLRIAGGCWAWAKMEQFEIWGAQGWAPSNVGDEVGFRLVLRERERERER